MVRHSRLISCHKLTPRVHSKDINEPLQTNQPPPAFSGSFSGTPKLQSRANSCRVTAPCVNRVNRRRPSLAASPARPISNHAPTPAGSQHRVLTESTAAGLLWHLLRHVQIPITRQPLQGHSTELKITLINVFGWDAPSQRG